VSLSGRDRKIVMFLVPLLLIAGYWFLLLAPKREEASTASTALEQQQERLETARTAARAADDAEQDFEASYAAVVRLGKAIPSTVDMPGLLVQLEAAAAGTGIRFNTIATGERTAATPEPAAPAEGGDTGGTPASDAGGAPAQTAPGGAVEAANDAEQTSDARNGAAEQTGVDTTTSTSASEGGLPVGGGAADGAADPAAAGVAGLETVPLNLEFEGNFFKLADFFHDLKRFVRVTNQGVLVSGRLISVDSVRWASDTETFPGIRAEVTATVYLSPLAQGATAGATPEGPTPATPAGTPATPAESAPASAPAPTATAIP
jgi:Tfp pilus assembly protein PilO